MQNYRLFDSRLSPRYQLQGAFNDVAVHPKRLSLSSCGTLIGTLHTGSVFEVRNVNTLSRHLYASDDDVYDLNDITWRPFFTQLASSSMDSFIRLWDVETGNVIQRFNDDQPVLNCEFYPDSNLLAAATNSKNIHLYDVRTGGMVNSISTVAHGISNLSFGADGKFLLGSELLGTCEIYDMHSREYVLSVETGIELLPQAMLANDFSIITSQINALKQWHPESGQVLKEFVGHISERYNTASNFSIAENRWLLTGSDSQELHIWDLLNGDHVQVLRAHEDVVLRTAAHPTQNIVVTSSYGNDTSIKIWQRM